MSRGPRWLLDQLPALERDGVIDAVTAARLRTHYVAAAASPAWGRLLSAGLGGLLMGLGVILLLAHNWEQWPRLPRVLISLAPLLAGQLLCLWTLRRKAADAGWREGSAAFTVAAFAAALALVGQLYHLPADLDRYLLTCALAGLPLLYLLQAQGVAVLYAGLIAGWAATGPAQPLLTTALLSLLLPQLLWLHRHPPAPLVASALWAALPPMAALAILISLHDGLRLGLLWVTQVGALFWLLNPPDQPGPRPAATRYGLLAVASAALIGSFVGFWDHDWMRRDGAVGSSWLLLTAVLAGLLWGAQRALRRDQWLRAAGVLPAGLLWLSLMFDPTPYAGPLAVLCNLFVAVLGVALIREGIAQQTLRLAHLGLGLLSLLILLRFLDTELSFTTRGLAFLIVGAGSLAFSRWLRRQVT